MTVCQNTGQITVRCPHCGTRRVLKKSEIDELKSKGKLIISDCLCKWAYTIKNEEDLTNVDN